MQYSWSLIFQHWVKLPDSRYCKDALPVYSESPNGTYCIRQGQGQSTAVSAPSLQCNYTKFEAVLQNYRWVVNYIGCVRSKLPYMSWHALIPSSINAMR